MRARANIAVCVSTFARKALVAVQPASRLLQTEQTAVDVGLRAGVIRIVTGERAWSFQISVGFDGEWEGGLWSNCWLRVMDGRIICLLSVREG